MKPRRIIVVGTLASNPYAGMAWMHMQIAAGLRRLGHDVYYFEFTSNWPYHPGLGRKVCDSSYAIDYLTRTCAAFGLDDRWAYRRSYQDNQWFGMTRGRAEDLLAQADAVLNIAGATRLAKEQLEVGRWVYYGTDPVLHEIQYEAADPAIVQLIDEHSDVLTYGENIGLPGCPIPPLPRLRGHTRQPVLLDHWQAGEPTRDVFTTVGNWKQVGLDLAFRGETYLWSKHHEFQRIIDLPRLTRQRFELAMNLGDRRTAAKAYNEAVPALGLEPDARQTLESHGWALVDAPPFTTDPWLYRDYVRASRGEFTVARDLNVRTRSGWFSERSACYLAAGRPVITQDTGFGTVLPVGEGLFAFNTMDDILAAVEAINADYPRHSRAARRVAEEYFRAETVMAKVLADLEI